MGSSHSAAAAVLLHQQGRGSDGAPWFYREGEGMLTPHTEAFVVTEQSRLASLF